jgi:hypothetical protein
MENLEKFSIIKIKNATRQEDFFSCYCQVKIEVVLKEKINL